MKRIILLLVLSLMAFTGGAQQINRAEYFIDTDNGVGMGTPISIATSGDQVNQAFSVPVNTLTPGFHRLGVRCRNTNGVWSQQITSLFFVLSSSSVGLNANINRAEYFIDTDPGVGAGVPITIATPGATVSQNVGINIGSLAQGFHRLVVRVRNTSGVWSQQISSLFFVLPNAPIGVSSNITRAEYFIDADPGVGNGTAIPPFTAGANVSSAFSIPVNTLSPGFHRLVVRLRDGAGVWSHQNSSLFYVMPNPPSAQQQQIVAAEWFVGSDPGVGNGTAITPIPAGNNVSILTDINIASLNLIEPNQIISIRVRDQFGNWSLHLSAPFTICQPTSTANFTSTTPCPNQAVTFTNTSTNVPNGATFQWDFNNDGVFDANGVGPHQFTYTTPGSYSAVLRITEGSCVAEVSRTINVPTVNPPSITVAGNNTTICPGTTAQLSTNFGSAYNWSGGAGNTQQVNVGPGTYTVTVTYTNGCTASSAPVTINSAPASTVSITAGGPTSFCPGGSVVLTANPAGATYAWNNGQTTRSITASTSGTFTATITPAGACPGTASAVVTLLPTPVVNAGADVSIALGQSTTLTATGASTYVWSPASSLSAATGSSVTATPSQTTTYSVQGTGANGCVGNDQVTVTVVQPTASFTGLLTSYCSNAQSSTLTGSPAGGTFSGPGVNGNVFNPANVGTPGLVSITYSVVNGLGETVSSTQTTTVLQAPQASISVQGSAIVCSPNTITLVASGGSSFQWVGGPSTAQFTVNSTGTYTVNVFNANGCQASASQVVTINPQPLANISADGPTSFCEGGQVVLTANTGASYLWSPGGQTTQSIVVTEVGSYSVQVTNSFGCSNTSLPTVVNVTSSPTPPVVQVNGSSTICSGSSVTLSSNVSNVSWFRQGNQNAIGSGSSIQVNQAGAYFARFQSTCGVVNSNIVQINVTTPLNPTFAAINPICAGAEAPVFPTLSQNGISGTWNPSTVSNQASGTYVFTPNAGQCATSTNLSVTVNPLPVVNAGADVSIALGQSTTLTATGASTYVWSPASSLSAATGSSVTATPSQTTTYSVQGTGANGCVGNDQVTVTVVQPNASFTGLLTSYCSNAQSSTLTGSPAGGTFSGPGVSGNVFNPANVGTPGLVSITYSVVNGLGETVSTTQTTTVLQAPQASISVQGSASVCSPNTITLVASGGSSFQWVGGPSTAQFTVNSTGTYTVNVFNANGCQASASQAVTINPQPLANISADGPTSFCEGGQVVLTANTGASYLWSPGGQTTQSIVVTEVGSYSVQVTNSFGCSNTSLPTVVSVTSSPTPPVVQVNGSSTICSGSSATLSSNVSNVSWFRQGNQNAIGSGSSIQVNQAGAYFARFQSTCGVVNSNIVQINVTTPLSPTFAAINPICAGAEAPVLPTLSQNGISGTWNPSTVSNQASGTYVFTPNAGQCATSTNLSVTVNPLPVVNAGADVSIQAGLSTTLSASGADSYVWSPATSLNVSNAASVIATPGVTTTYTVVGTSAAGCTVQDEVVVTVIQPTNISFTGLAANYCLNAAPSVLVGTPAGGTFSGPGVNGNTFDPSVAGVGIKTITYTVIGIGGTLQTSQSTEVILAGSSSIPVSICAGETYTLPNGDEVGAGQYTITVDNGFGCNSVSTFVVTEIEVDDVTQSAAICAGEPFTLPDGAVVSPSETTTYTIARTDEATGCAFNLLFTLTVKPRPENTTVNASICQGQSYQLPDGQLVNSGGTYVVNLTAENGCSYTTTVILTVNPNLSSTVNATINAGETYTLPDGSVVSQSGQYVTVLQTASGCSNTITTNLTVIAEPGGCYVTSVVASHTLQGQRKSGQPVLAIRSNTAQALGAPDAVQNNVVNFYSLGFGGYITLKFEQPIANGGGVDVRVYEATWNNKTCDIYPERAEVFGSQDGCNFMYMGEVCQSGSVSIPAVLPWIQYVQIRDISNPSLFGANDDGYDVAGVECLNGASTSSMLADLSPGTLQDIPTYLPGNTKNGNTIPQNRRIKEQAIGFPGGSGINFVSLGFGGSLIGKFDFVVFNREGQDLQIVETSFGNPGCNSYPERTQVFVSKDGSEFISMGELCLDGMVELGSIPWIQYIKLVDVSPLASSRFNGAADGFDLDGVLDLHACFSGTQRFANADNVTEPNEEWMANLYPNPTYGQAQLELVDLPQNEPISLVIYDATGRVIRQQHYSVRDSQINISLDLSDLAFGAYQLSVITLAGNKVLKLMKH